MKPASEIFPIFWEISCFALWNNNNIVSATFMETKLHFEVGAIKNFTMIISFKFHCSSMKKGLLSNTKFKDEEAEPWRILVICTSYFQSPWTSLTSVPVTMHLSFQGLGLL